jgi:hypothetical protein
VKIKKNLIYYIKSLYYKTVNHTKEMKYKEAFILTLGSRPRLIYVMDEVGVIIECRYVLYDSNYISRYINSTLRL